MNGVDTVRALLVRWEITPRVNHLLRGHPAVEPDNRHLNLHTSEYNWRITCLRMYCESNRSLDRSRLRQACVWKAACVVRASVRGKYSDTSNVTAIAQVLSPSLRIRQTLSPRNNVYLGTHKITSTIGH